MKYLPGEGVENKQRQTTRETMDAGSDTFPVLRNCLVGLSFILVAVFRTQILQESFIERENVKYLPLESVTRLIRTDGQF